MTEDLPPRERALLDRACRFAAEIIAPAAAGWEQRREPVGRDAFRRYGQEGFCGLMVPESLGGQGASFRLKVRVAEAMARDCFAATFALNNTQSTVLRLARDGTAEQRQRLLGPMLRGELVCAPAISEPGAGSDATSMTTAARRVEGGWRITGIKAWVTNGAHADLLLLYAQTVPGGGARGIASFLVDAGASGVRRAAPYALIGGAAAGAAALALEDVFVPDRDLASPPGQAFRAAMAGITGARVHVAAMANGVVAECLERAVARAGTRTAFGRTLLEHQGLRWSLADVATRLEAARLLVDRAAALVDAGRDATFEAAQAKLFAVDAAASAVSACMQVCGADGLTDEQPFARHLAGARIAAYVDGTSEVQRDRIGAMLAERYPLGAALGG